MKQDTPANLSFIEPMNALRVRDLPDGNWIYEVKFDGYRALAFKADKEVRFVSRNRTVFNNDYPELVDALKLLSVKNAIIDGEITVLDQNGKSSFQLLQSYGKTKQTPLVYYAFDLLFLDGTDLRSRPLGERRKLLAKLLRQAPDNIRFSEDLRGTGDEVLRVARQFGLEGLVAKKPDSRYESGRRSGAWVKVKLTQQQEFVIGGYTLPEGGHQYLRRFACGLPRSWRVLVCRQSRHRLFRKDTSGALRRPTEDQTRSVSLYQPAGEKARALGAWYNPSGYETLSMGRTGASGSNQVYRVDFG